MSAYLDRLLTPQQRAACRDYGRPTTHPLDPRNDQDDVEASVPTVEQLTEEVADEQLRTPELVAWTIGRLSSDKTDALPVSGIEDMAAQTFDTLLACAFGGSNDQVLPAMVQLRERIKAHNADIAAEEAQRRHAAMLPTLQKAYEDAQRARFEA